MKNTTVHNADLISTQKQIKETGATLYIGHPDGGCSDIGEIKMYNGFVIVEKAYVDKLENELKALRDLLVGKTIVESDTISWMLGEFGDFVCPEDQCSNGKHPRYFWRKTLRNSIVAVGV